MGAVDHAAAGDDVGDRLITASGTPESSWQAWSGLGSIAALDVSALVPPDRRAVVIAPHPDDEVLGAGGLLAMLAALGREILIVGVTDGGASHPGSQALPPLRLVRQRQQERRAGLRVLGIDQPSLTLGFTDGSLSSRRAALEDALLSALRATDVVFAPWRRDGHPDHEASGHAAAAACAKAGATLVELPIWMWHWARPKDARVPWRSAVRVDIGGVLDSKRAAIACHHSQIGADASSGAAAVLAPWALARWLRPFEVFFL